MCSSCGWDEEVFEEDAVPEDRLHAALAAAYSQLGYTTTGQIQERVPAPYQGEHGLEPNRDELGEL